MYQRVIIWEDFIEKHPDFFLKDEARSFYILYLSTIITGMDNSPLFDWDTRQILPEIKSLYENIVAQKNLRKSTEIIVDYYRLLQLNNFEQLNDVYHFLEAHNLQ